jgi:adenosylmethionine-8-amino-7-oxononanoate aminotransferase
MPKPPKWFEHGWQHIWLPYAQMQTTPTPLPVVGAHGSRLQLADGRELIDGTASWWSMCHGYQHPAIVEAIQTQAGTLSHVMFAGLAHEPAYMLAKELSAITPDGLERVFFAESGSVAVEVALKMALQYWRNKGESKKTKFICFSHSYHGDTVGAMSVSGRSGFNAAYDSLTLRNFVLDMPQDEYGFAEFSDMVAAIADSSAALILEPLVQCAGGFRFYPADILSEIIRICREHHVLVIADEIATGFGRTGAMFACNEAGIAPDIMCVGKALTGGHISLAATLASNMVFDAFLGTELERALMHGPTFMANPIACAAARTSLALFKNETRIAQVEAIEAQLRAQLAPCRDVEGVEDVRIKGAIGVVELAMSWEAIFAMRERFVARGVWLRPFGNTLYVMPSFTITPDELTQLTSAMLQEVKEASIRG